MRWGNIDTENLITCEWIEGTQRQTGQSTQTAYCEYLLRTGKVPDHGRQPSVLAYARRSCAAKSTANTFKTSEKNNNTHLGRQIACLPRPSVSIHERAFKNKYGIKEVFAQAICISCYDTALSPP